MGAPEIRNLALPPGFTPANLSWPLEGTAVVQGDDGAATIQHNVQLPIPPRDMIIVKTIAVSINPCDWKMSSKFPTPGAQIGCDFSGIVIAIGPDADTDRINLKVGDRVCGGVHGSNPIDPTAGAFASYVIAHGDLLFRLPDDVSWEAGAVLGASVISTLSIVLREALSLKGTLERPLSGESPYVLVYGASTSTGTMAVQVLALSGYKVVATCSPGNFDLVKSFGADAVFDYRSPTCATEIREYTNRSLNTVLDVITDARSQTICGNVFGRTGGRYAVLELPDPNSPIAQKRTVKTQMVVGLAATGKEIALAEGYERAANPELRKQAAEMFQSAQRLLDEGRFKTHPARVLTGGFEAILKGIDILRNMGTSGEKLVCFIDQEAEAEYVAH